MRLGNVVGHSAAFLPDLVEFGGAAGEPQGREDDHLLLDVLRRHLGHREAQRPRRHRRGVAVDPRGVGDQAAVGVVERDDGLRADHLGAVRVEPPRDPAGGALRGLEGDGDRVRGGVVVVEEGGAQVREVGAGAERSVTGEGVAGARLRVTGGGGGDQRSEEKKGDEIERGRHCCSFDRIGREEDESTELLI